MTGIIPSPIRPPDDPANPSNAGGDYSEISASDKGNIHDIENPANSAKIQERSIQRISLLGHRNHPGSDRCVLLSQNILDEVLLMNGGKVSQYRYQFESEI